MRVIFIMTLVGQKKRERERKPQNLKVEFLGYICPKYIVKQRN